MNPNDSRFPILTVANLEPFYRGAGRPTEYAADVKSAEGAALDKALKAIVLDPARVKQATIDGLPSPAGADNNAAGTQVRPREQEQETPNEPEDSEDLFPDPEVVRSVEVGNDYADAGRTIPITYISHRQVKMVPEGAAQMPSEEDAINKTIYALRNQIDEMFERALEVPKDELTDAQRDRIDELKDGVHSYLYAAHALHNYPEDWKFVVETITLDPGFFFEAAKYRIIAVLEGRDPIQGVE